ncbi:BTB/POZ domain-containing protein 9-like [Adelges cooleyi]|uniref:BTB/POZ domain-containing protein 9-like n=1 Tax=Adelges cooleyi TaxID=133065 RepID=UPI00217FC608|nr:BTB/POZ domain-containing protein 9-like [Adelges cooleyi]
MDWAILKSDLDCVLIQLAQPYVLSSLRILLNDGDSETCGYIIHVSVNNEVWVPIVDKSKKPVHSLELLKFDPTPIVYIRITAVRHLKNYKLIKKVFIEAPAQVSQDSNATLKQSRSIFCF